MKLLRSFGRWTLTVVNGLCLGASVAAFGGRWNWVLDLLTHGRPQYLICSALLMTVCLVRRKWRGAGMAAVALGLNAAVVLPYASEGNTLEVRDGGRVDEKPVQVLKVASINLLQFGRPDRDFGKLRRDLEPWQPEVIALQELGTQWAREIDLWKDWFPHQSLDQPTARIYGRALLSRLPWRRLERVMLGPRPATMGVAAEIEVNGKVVSILTVHAIHPVDAVKVAALKQWHAEIVNWVKSKQAAGHAVLVLGDFNCTPWSHLYRDFVKASGLREAGRGNPFRFTWSVGRPYQMMIDHVFYSEDWRSAYWSVGEDFGSDHRPVLVELRWR